MVQILPRATSISADIGDSLRQGFSSGIEQGAKVGFQRNLLQNALKQASQVAQDPNTSPLERNLALLGAFAGIPGSERYIGQILPQLNQMAAFGQQGTTPLGGQPVGANNAQPQMQTGAEGLRQTPQMVGGQPMPKATEQAFPNEEVDLYEPFLGQGVRKYNPLEINAIELQDLANGLPSSPRAEKMRKDNLEIENAVKGISDRQKEFANYYNAIHPNMAIDDQRIAQRFYRTKEALTAPTNEEKARVVDNFLDRYRSLKTNIAHQLPRSMIDKTRTEQEGEARNQVQWLLDEGQRDLAKELLTGADGTGIGFGDAESERILKPPSKTQEKLLTDFPKLPESSTQVPTFGKYARQFQTKNAERSKALDQYEARLQKAIEPGTARNPGTSLLVLRDIAMQAGLSWTEYNEKVNKLVNQGKVKLDPYQLQELPKLTSPPHAGFFDMLIERK